MSKSIADLPAHEVSGRVRRGELSAMQVLEAALSRIRAVEGRAPSLDPGAEADDDRNWVHAFTHVTEEMALKQAEAVDRTVADGEDPGPLAGVPLAVKDNFCVAGTPTTAGSKILDGYVAPYTATPVARLTAAGAVVVGKVNLDEFTFGSSNESTAYLPPPGNPWNTRRVPGGSSGGSVAAVAAGEAAISLASDTAGSIRQPAAFTGVVGLKPTYGRISRYGLIAFASSLDCPGLVGREVRDVALAFAASAGRDPRDATTAEQPVPPITSELDGHLAGMRIGLSPDYFKLIAPAADGVAAETSALPAEIREAVERAAEALAGAGAEIVEDVPMPNTRFAIPAYFVISRVEAASNLHRYDGVKYGFSHEGDVADLLELYRKSRGGGFGPQAKLRILMGMYVSAAQYEKAYYDRALRVRTMIRQDFERAFDPEGPYRLDALLTPTTPSTAFELGAVYGDSVMMQYADSLTVPANHAGIPAVSVPAGFDDAGLPIGIQLIGADFNELGLLQVARGFELATESEDWRKRRPEVLARAA